MPNWCLNHLSITHQDPAIIKRIQDAVAQEKFFDAFVPVPKKLKIISGFLGDQKEQEELEVLQEANRDTHGYKDWYDFCINEWGTKWEAFSVEIVCESPTSLEMRFETAWSPPINFYEKMANLGCEIAADYYEPGCAFVGTWRDGVDECYEIPSDITGIKEQIPEYIDEFWGISDSLEEV